MLASQATGMLSIERHTCRCGFPACGTRVIAGQWRSYLVTRPSNTVRVQHSTPTHHHGVSPAAAPELSVLGEHLIPSGSSDGPGAGGAGQAANYHPSGEGGDRTVQPGVLPRLRHRRHPVLRSYAHDGAGISCLPFIGTGIAYGGDMREASARFICTLVACR